MAVAPAMLSAPAAARIATIEARMNTLRGLATGESSSFSSMLGGLLGSGSTGDPTASTGTVGGDGTAGVGGDDVVTAASRYLGIPYKWGGTDPSKGLDCSGLVQRAYADVGIDLPRVSRDQARAGVGVAWIADARPGDLIAFGEPVDHIGIYAGNGRFIEAPRTGQVVKFSPIRRGVTAIRRVIPETTGVTSSAASARLGLARRTGAIDLSASRTGASTGMDGPLPAGVPYRAQFEASAARHGVPSRLLAALAKEESGYRTDAVSSVGALGLMQFMPATARSMNIDPLDPTQAIDGAARYLKAQMDRFGSTDLALAAYSAGPSAVARAGGVPNYAETRNAIRKVHAIVNGGTW